MEAQPILKQVQIKSLCIQYWFDLGVLPVLEEAKMVMQVLLSQHLQEVWDDNTDWACVFWQWVGATPASWLWCFLGWAGSQQVLEAAVAS